MTVYEDPYIQAFNARNDHLNLLARVWDDAVRDTFRHCVENPHWTPGDIKDRNPYREGRK